MRRFVLCFSALLLGGCDVFEIDGPVFERVVAQIQPDSQGGVQVQSAASVGAPFLVRIVTRGGGCTRGGDTVVRISESPILAAELVPYDFEPVRFPPRTGCDDIETTHVHDAYVTFARAGEARITVLGRSGATAVRTIVITAAR